MLHIVEFFILRDGMIFIGYINYVMDKIVFKGIKQVTMDAYQSATDKKGYLWFVRETIQKQEGSQSPFEENRFHIYFGETKYGESWAGTYEAISALAEAISENFTLVNTKQDIIADLSEIRNGASLGSTALQSYTEEYRGTIDSIDADGSLDEINSLPFLKYVEQTLNEEQKEQVSFNLGIKKPYEFYQTVGGILNERQYNTMVKYSFTPFMISSNSVTVIPDDLLNENKTNFFTDWYWNAMRLTGGEPIMTIQWQNNIPYKFKGMVNGKIYRIDFNNKTITPES